MCSEMTATRRYTLRRRAERQAGTRARIVEATMSLHASVGPARTTVSMIAERAGVQRHTVYAHFPDETSLLQACSERHLATSPPPEAAAWAAVPAGRERLAAALRDIYGWYGRNHALLGAVLRDAEWHAPTAAILHARFGPIRAGWEAALLGPGDGPERQALLRLALAFEAWRVLCRDGGLAPAAAAAAMAAALAGAGMQAGVDVLPPVASGVR
jgi:AcrR family transcriptional regulator